MELWLWLLLGFGILAGVIFFGLIALAIVWVYANGIESD